MPKRFARGLSEKFAKDLPDRFAREVCSRGGLQRCAQRGLQERFAKEVDTIGLLKGFAREVCCGCFQNVPFRVRGSLKF